LSDGATDYSATPEWDGAAATASIAFDFTGDDMSAAETLIHRSVTSGTQDFYTQSEAGAPVTPWRRLLIFHPICETAGGLTYKDDGQTCGADPKTGIRVESRLEWQRKGQTFQRVMYEDLFDWR
jgi:hypothetical protein